jgi:hypothetical protein
MTTDTATHPVEDYLARVLTALGDLPAAERDDLVEDLDLHLREVAAETEGSLEERLGSPEQYAAELRASAGLPTALPPDRGVAARPRAALAAALSHPRAVSLRSFLVTLRPGWWVLRGYLAVAAPSLLRGAVPSSLPIPNVNGPWFGGVLVCAAVAVSVWFGLRRPPLGTQYLVAAVNIAVVILSIVAASHVRDDLVRRAELANAAFAAPAYADEYSPYLLSPRGRITNIYPYDAKGRPLSGVQLFDESGNPINLPNQTDLSGQTLRNQFGTTPAGNRIRNAYPVRQVVVPGRSLVLRPTVKVARPAAEASPAKASVTKAHQSKGNSEKRHGHSK